MPAKIEDNRDGFRSENLRQAQKRSWESLRAIQAAIRPGMTELEAKRKGEEILRERGAGKNWHRVIVRFGENTLCKFNDPAKPGLVLQENDICFLDLGPLWEIEGMNYEGDVGDAFVFGNDPERLRCAEGARELFRRVSGIWKSENLSGAALYARAVKEAAAIDLELNHEVDGHRVGDFPHQVFYKGGMNEIDFKPAAGLWILEMQVKHPKLPFGAFYEDLLG